MLMEKNEKKKKKKNQNEKYFKMSSNELAKKVVMAKDSMTYYSQSDRNPVGAR